jgi:predicted DsbA family dithiol-disulfide isomerase
VFSDFTCPYCYVTDAALRSSAASSHPIAFHALELHPDAPRPAPALEPEWRSALADLAAELHLPLAAPDFRPSSLKAHEAARWARDHGIEREMREAIFHAYWADMEDIGRIDVLERLAAGLNTDSTALKIALDIDRHAEEVLADLRLAERLRITSSPTLFLGIGKDVRILVGAQSPASLDAALATR